MAGVDHGGVDTWTTVGRGHVASMDTWTTVGRGHVAGVDTVDHGGWCTRGGGEQLHQASN